MKKHSVFLESSIAAIDQPDLIPMWYSIFYVFFLIPNKLQES